MHMITDLKENQIPSYLDIKSVLEFKDLKWYREGLTIDTHGSYIKGSFAVSTTAYVFQCGVNG